jgi:hypothetical protein
MEELAEKVGKTADEMARLIQLQDRQRNIKTQEGKTEAEQAQESGVNKAIRESGFAKSLGDILKENEQAFQAAVPVGLLKEQEEAKKMRDNPPDIGEPQVMKALGPDLYKAFGLDKLPKSGIADWLRTNLPNVADSLGVGTKALQDRLDAANNAIINSKNDMAKAVQADAATNPKKLEDLITKESNLKQGDPQRDYATIRNEYMRLIGLSKSVDAKRMFEQFMETMTRNSANPTLVRGLIQADLDRIHASPEYQKRAADVGYAQQNKTYLRDQRSDSIWQMIMVNKGLATREKFEDKNGGINNLTPQQREARALDAEKAIPELRQHVADTVEAAGDAFKENRIGWGREDRDLMTDRMREARDKSLDKRKSQVIGAAGYASSIQSAVGGPDKMLQEALKKQDQAADRALKRQDTIIDLNRHMAEALQKIAGQAQGLGIPQEAVFGAGGNLGVH